jgi:hypothetical protein
MKRHLFICITGIVLVALALGCGGRSSGPAGPVIDSVEGNGATPDKVQDAIIVKGSGFIAGDTVEVRDAAGRPLTTGVIDTTMVSATELNLNIDPGMFKTGDCDVVIKRSGNVVARAVGPSTFLIVGPAGPQGIQGIQGDVGPQGLKGDPGDPAPVYTAGTGIVVDNGAHTISADFGIIAGTVAEGNHDHAGVYSPVAHDHDARYYTEAEMDALLTAKSNTGHNHDATYSQLSHNHDTAYSQLGHNHDVAYINDGAGEINAANDFNFAASTFVPNLDADTVDGKHATAFMDLANYDTSPDGIVDRSEYADTAGDADTVDGKHAAGFWQLTGNTGTTPGTHFLGTTDNKALELKVNGQRALRLEPVAGGANVIGGSYDNSVTAGVIGATISGGGLATAQNIVTDNFGTIGGGMANLAGDAAGTTDDAQNATVSGGLQNTAAGDSSTIGGGCYNVTVNSGTTVSGGSGNVAGGNGPYGTVSGGADNLASGQGATISGGGTNTASGINATVGGGSGNTAGGDSSFVGGGAGNTADNSFATVGGGQSNIVNGDSSVIAGGWDNLINDWQCSVIGGGISNEVGATVATIAGGGENFADGAGAAIGGGSFNTASGIAAAIPGGDSNTALGDWSFAAGNFAQANHNGAFVWSDTDPVNNWPFASTAVNQFSARATGGFRFVTGMNPADGSPTHGLSIPAGTNTISAIGTDAMEIYVGNQRVLRFEPSIWGSNVIEGDFNVVKAGTIGATISGGGGFTGITNFVWADYGTVGGGGNNSASGDYSTVSGGTTNFASGNDATVGGGGFNLARGVCSTIAGGGDNDADGTGSTVGGGGGNDASGDYATIPGGWCNTALGSYSFATGYGSQANVDYSFALGYNALANHTGAFVWADSTGVYLTSSAANEFSALASGGVRFFTSADLSTGVTLSAGGSGWIAVSDVNKKENFADVSGEEVLSKVATMPVTSWNYKTQDESIRHIGPTAQDFKAAFNLGESAVGINSIDIDGVNLAAVKALALRTTELKAANEALQKENDELKARLAAIEAKLGISTTQK